MVHSARPLPFLLALLLALGLALTTGPPARAQTPDMTVKDNKGNKLLRLLENGNLRLFQNGDLTVPGMIESTGGGVLLPDGTTLGGVGDLGPRLPFSGSVGASNPAFEIENTGSGPALRAVGNIVAGSGDIVASSGDFVLSDGTRLGGSGDLGSFSLPFSGSASSSNPAFEIGNSGSGPAIRAGSGDIVAGSGAFVLSDGTELSGSGDLGGVPNTSSGAFDLSNDEGILAGGTEGTGSIPAEGAGTRMMWYPGKAAFRVGEVGVNKDGTQWNDGSIGTGSVAFGLDTKANGDVAVAMGFITTASGDFATAMGRRTTASSDRATAMGLKTTASGPNATAMGEETTASGNNATAMGYQTTANDADATAMGDGTRALGPDATAMGRETTATGPFSTAMGDGTTASAPAATAMGDNTEASETDATAMGFETTASGGGATAMGNNTTASGNQATAMGNETTASSRDATAMGDNTTASGENATAMGAGTRATGRDATAMGDRTTASVDDATAMGVRTTASGPDATAMGDETTASGPDATAMGNNTTASADDATAMGLSTTAATGQSLSIGEYNSANTSADNTLFVAGNGSSGSRSDALVLDQSGDLSIEGVFNAELGTYAGHLQGSKNQREIDDPTAHIALIRNISTGDDADGLAIQAGPFADPGQGVNYISFFDGDGNSNGDIEGNGSGGVVYETSGNDYAEELPVAEGATVPEATDLVGVRGGTVRLDTEDANRVMIASRAPAVTGNTTPSDATDDARRVAVAFVGQVPARVRGKTEVGDLIVASGQDDGTARAVSPPAYRPSEHGPIAGQAWEAKAAEEVGEVTVAVGLGQSGTIAKRLEEQQAQIASLKKQVRQIESMKERLVALEQGRTAPTRWVGASWTSGHGRLLIAFLLGGLLGAGLLVTRRS